MPPIIDANQLLTRDKAAKALTEAGYPTSPKTLATKATRGGGPPYQKFGPRPLYRWGAALAWAEGRLGPEIASTSEADVGLKPSRSAAAEMCAGRPVDRTSADTVAFAPRNTASPRDRR
jgi:hypothetical protein